MKGVFPRLIAEREKNETVLGIAMAMLVSLVPKLLPTAETEKQES